MTGEPRPWSWHLDRAAVLLLVALLPVHLLSFHLGTDPQPLTVAGLEARWDGPWRLVDWLTLELALLHGGLTVQRRHGPGPVATATLVLVGVVTGTLTYVVFSLGFF